MILIHYSVEVESFYEFNARRCQVFVVRDSPPARHHQLRLGTSCISATESRPADGATYNSRRSFPFLFPSTFWALGSCRYTHTGSTQGHNPYRSRTGPQISAVRQIREGSLLRESHSRRHSEAPKEEAEIATKT